MSNLKRSFFWAAFYLAVLFILGQTDYMGRPIINFAAYFYLAAIVAFPITLFFPSISRASAYVPLGVWAGIYLVLLQTLNRETANTGEFSVIVLEFVFLEVGVWFAHRLAVQLSHAESVMDALALSAFPNSARDIEAESQRIKIEFTRSRRYHRPLSLLIMEPKSQNEATDREMLKSVQHDLMKRFTLARIGQIIDDRIRQTDLILKDSHGRFAILCPETDVTGVTSLAERIVQAVAERTTMQIAWGAAAFPDDALTFDDLLQHARGRLMESKNDARLYPATVGSEFSGS
jgi:GGDEF domain-containing protein